jgi:preprotein translocase subunit SecE
MATQTQGQSAERRGGAGRAAKRDRTTPALFTRQVAAELRKVIWPTRHELVTYTTVALVFIIFMSAIVLTLDYGFTKLMFEIFG